MATSSVLPLRALRALAGAVLLLWVASVAAAPRFIAASQVREADTFSEITLELRCKVHYVDHAPHARGSILRIRVEPTTICTGAPPSVALSRELHRPSGAGKAWLDSIEYDGAAAGSEFLTLTFATEVTFEISAPLAGDVIRIRVTETAASDSGTVNAAVPRRGPVSRRVRPEAAPPVRYVVNLASSQRRPATTDVRGISLDAGQVLLVAEAQINGATWYRLQVGYFGTSEDAARALRALRSDYPGAWIGRADETVSPLPVSGGAVDSDDMSAGPTEFDGGEQHVAALMEEARSAMIAGELARAVQIYTKVLSQPQHDLQPQAQEFLALARERNGQIAHAKAEYERYLELYPDGDGADRVRQRLAALLASRSPAATPAVIGEPGEEQERGRRTNPWSLRTFVSQYYRRDVNQVDDQDEIVNQSSIYTDASFDARRRGERFDVAARITAGYRNDLLGNEARSDDDLRLSYAWFDVADAVSGLRARLGRQTRNTGGVLGRFDGLNTTYSLNDKLRFDVVIGSPVYSTASDDDDSRSFAGLSSTFTPFGSGLEFGAFLLQQEVEGLTDRNAAGVELRYFGAGRSLWGTLSYDAEFADIGSAFLQGSWRLPGNLTITGLIDRRRSPFLSLGNARVGQPVEAFSEMLVLFTEAELQQLALDRSPEVTTVSAGMSRPLSPQLQFNLNFSRSSIAATPESGGVPATASSEYSYYSADLVASSVFTEGDVGIVGLRYSVSDTTDIYSVNLDSRYPIGRAWRVAPRLRVEYREIRADGSTQWMYTPALRLQYRPGRRWRFELEAGKRFARRDMALSEQQRESEYIHLGYQFFY